MIAVADPLGRRAHDAYHRFVRDGAWFMNQVWRALATHLVGRFCPTGVVELACDDTLFHHETTKLAGQRGAGGGHDHEYGVPATVADPGLRGHRGGEPQPGQTSHALRCQAAAC